ncbi:type I secretion C-terminal target domain-containing protein [Sinorhizobium alkalisoli]|uniref:type I secretion C-terminal target domain-containing protein n=1 Tax=Sinorhizobium alkalisoli TaxID=1752398 RepID=UPI00124F15BB|nr:type I secretion C-terminal target domain-containing protein [Sinorhizobium alkalisoli]QFI69846.1 Flagellar hook-length control protein FliK [Sinorhizobium alkalisoli]
MATEGFSLSASADALTAGNEAVHDDLVGKGGRLVAQAADPSEPQLLDPATGGPADNSGAAPVARMPESVKADANNVVRLPAGISLENIKVVGNDIVLEQPGGAEIRIENAALNIPTFVIGDVEIPRETLVAVLEGNGINVAAGPDGTISVVSGQSSGGNFSDASAGIGDAGPAIDLLPPTALQFPELEQQELRLFAELQNETPSISPDPDGGSAGGIGVSDRQVDEAGLTDGSRAGDGSATVTGVFVLSDPDGLDDIASLTINGQTFAIGDLVGQTIAGQYGTLTITSYDSSTGVVEYLYELTKPVTGSEADNGANTEQDRDVFDLAVTDSSGASGSATLRIDVNDDVPAASSEAVQVVAEGTTVTGTFDFAAGADGATLTHVNGTAVGAFDATTGWSGWIDLGEGAIRVKADGSYEFKADDATTGASLPVSGNYTVADGDGDTATADFGFTVTDANTPTGGTAAATVDDDGLAGANPAQDAGLASFSGTLGGSVGGDGAGANGFSFAGLNGTTGTVGQETVSYSWNGATNTLTATGPRGVLFTVTVTDPATGAYTVALVDNVLQTAGPNGEDNVTVDLGYTVTDADNSTASGTLTVTFNDDVPAASSEAVQAAAEGTTVTGTFDFAAGADGATLTHVNGTAVGAFDATTGWSGWIDLGEGAIRVKADGSYEFKADDATTGASLPVSGSYTVTDGDGDTATADFGFTVTDANTPTGGTAAATVDDDGLAGANPAQDAGLASFSGTLGGSVGGDGAGANGFSFAGLNGTTGTVGQETVSYSWNGATNTLTATGPRGVLFTVTVTNPVTGAYTVALVDNVLQTAGPNGEDNVTVDLGYTVTDADNSSANGTLTVTFNDDVPAASNEAVQVVAEGATVTGTFDFAAGADGATLTHVNGTAVGAFDATTGWSGWIDLGEGAIRVKADGSYEFKADDATTGASLPVSGSYTVTDGDGDTATADFGFTVTDANTPTGGTAAATVDDDGLAGANPAQDAGLASFSGTLGGSVGGDGAGANGFSFAGLNGTTGTVGQETVSYSWNGATNTLTATGPRGVLFTVTVTNPVTGAYTVALVDNVLQTAGPNGEDNVTVDLGYTVTDADNSSANGTLTVTFNDDVPAASNEAVQVVAEGATVTGTFDFAAGADGATLTHVNGTAVGAFDATTGWSGWIDLGEGAIRVKADGSYEFKADDATTGASLPVSGSYTVTDGDGDTATADFGFTVTDANTPTGGTAAATVDDDGLAGANPAQDAGLASFSGTLGGSVGGDGAGANGFSFAGLNGTTGTVGQETVSYSWNGATNTLTATGPRGVLFTVTVTDPVTGAYTVALVDNVLQTAGPNGEDNVTVDLGYTVTDADNSTASGTLTVTFNDDVPAASSEAVQAAAEGTTVTGTFDFAAGADGATLTHVNGTAVGAFDATTGWSGWIDLGEGAIRVKADGSYEFKADDATTGASLPVSGSYTVTDGDGDTATADFGFTVTDANTPTGGTAAATVDDDGLAGANPAQDAGLASFSGTLGGSVGGDGAGANGFSFAGLNGTTGTVGQETVSYSWNGATNTLTATGPRGVLFTVTVTNPVTGAYTVALVDNVLQTAGPNGEDNVTVDLGYTVTDADNSTASGTLTVTFNDDVPAASNEAVQAVAEGTTVTGTFDFVAGADGATLTHVNGTAVGAFDATTGWSGWIDLGEGAIRVKADGSYEFKADDATTGASLPVSGSYTVTDGDGDTATADFGFTVTDANTPTGGTAAATVDDDGLAGANPAQDAGLASFSGTLGGSVGGDGAGANGFSFAGLNGTTGTVGQETVSYSWNGATNTLTATGPRGVLFTVTVTDPVTGAYTVALVDNVLQTAGPNGEDNVTVDLGYTVTDADNSTASGTLTVTFNDDVPAASSEAVQAAAEGTTVTGTFDFAAGADGATLTHVNGTAVGAFDATTGWSGWIDLGEGAIRVKADGSYEFKADDATTGASLPVSGSYTVTDGDGDTATADFGFTVTDANTPTGGTAAATVDDDGLAGANPAQDAGLASFSGTLGGSVGGDGAGANGFSFAGLNGTTGTVGQETVSYSWNGATNTLTATGPRGVLFTVTVTNPVTGAYTVALVDNVLQTAGPNGEDNVTVDLGYTVTDADNSTANGTLTVTFNDDVPAASSEAVQVVAEGATVTGTFDFAAGADGATLTHVNGTAVGAFDATTGWSGWIDLGEGAIRVKADGSYEFKADDATTGASLPVSGNYTVADGDGDTATADFGFTVTDANTPTGGTAAATVDDDGLAGANPAQDAGLASFSGTLGGSVGGDGAGANGFSFAGLNGTTGTVGQETVSYSWNGATNTLTATGPRGVLFTVTVTDPATGAYTVALVDNVLQTAGPNGEDNVTVDLGYTVTDADNSTASGTLTVTFNDDVPTFTSVTDAIVANQSNSTVTGLHDLNLGADGGTINISALSSISGVTYQNPVHNADGSVTLLAVAGGSDFFSVTIKPDGTYDFTLINARPTISQTFGFGGVNGSASTTQFTLGDATFYAVDTNNNGSIGSNEELKPTSNGFGVSNGNLDPDEQFKIGFPSLVDAIKFNVNLSGNDAFVMAWKTNTGETGTVSAGSTGWLTINPLTDFSSITFTVMSGKAKLDGVEYSKLVLPSDQTLQFDVSGTDGDGDTSSHQTLDVRLLGSSSSAAVIQGTSHDDAIAGTSGNDVIHGGDGNDILYGGAGHDILYGGAGDDTLYGGLGDDTIYGGAGSDTLSGGAGADTFVIADDELQLGIDDVITDYNAAEGDVVDLSALLGELAPGTLEQHVQIVQDGENANLQVDTDGSGNSASWQTVAVLENFSVSDEVVKILFNESGTKTTGEV